MYGDSLVKGMTERNIWQEEWQEISNIGENSRKKNRKLEK